MHQVPRRDTAQRSIDTNPYAFWAPFSGLVAPAAYNFIINFMSNHTAAEPSGYLDGKQFKQCFAVTGTYPNFRWLPGQERIPDNWYRRLTDNSYNIPNIFQDLGSQFLAYPNQFKLGGNTGKTNSFVGVSLSTFTGNTFTNANILQGNNLQCYAGQFIQAAIPDLASKPLQLANGVNSLVNTFIKPITNGLDCPAVAKYDQTLFNKYPGYTYSPTGKGTNY